MTDKTISQMSSPNMISPLSSSDVSTAPPPRAPLFAISIDTSHPVNYDNQTFHTNLNELSTALTKICVNLSKRLPRLVHQY